MSTTLAESSASTMPGSVLRVSPLRVVGALGGREMVRFFRQKNRVIGAVGQPVLFWLLFGTGLQSTFRRGSAEGGFREYFFPGTLVLIVLFTAIFATISVIEDRREGFLQSVLVAPIPRWSMVLGKLLGGTLIATLQALLFLGLTLFLDIPITMAGFFGSLTLLFIVALGLTGLGFVLAWQIDSTQGYHAVMSLLLLPMWLLSGAFFPAPAVGAEAGLLAWGIHLLMKVNPLTYGVAGVRRLMFGDSLGADVALPELHWCWAVSIAFAAAALALSCAAAGRRTSGDLL